MTEIIDALPGNTLSRTQKRSRAQMEQAKEQAVLQLPETAHVPLEHAVHTDYCM
jgi:hypothetical protein